MIPSFPPTTATKMTPPPPEGPATVASRSANSSSRGTTRAEPLPPLVHQTTQGSIPLKQRRAFHAVQGAGKPNEWKPVAAATTRRDSGGSGRFMRRLHGMRDGPRTYLSLTIILLLRALTPMPPQTRLGHCFRPVSRTSRSVGIGSLRLLKSRVSIILGIRTTALLGLEKESVFLVYQVLLVVT